MTSSDKGEGGTWDEYCFKKNYSYITPVFSPEDFQKIFKVLFVYISELWK